MKHLQFMLVLAIAVNVWECGDAKFGERGEISPRRRRCYDGSMPKRLKKRDRKLSVDSGGSGGSSSSGEVCSRLYPRVSCCPTRRAAYQILHRRDAHSCLLGEGGRGGEGGLGERERGTLAAKRLGETRLQPFIVVLPRRRQLNFPLLEQKGDG